MTDGSMDALAGQRVLVTGGAGVIARELLDGLSTAGASVLSVDRLPLPTDPPPGVEHLVADLAFADLEPIARFRPRHVFHLAATFERSVESPEFWAQNWSDNVVVTHRLAELAAGLGEVESFVFASSYLVYDPEQYSTTASGPPSPGSSGYTGGARATSSRAGCAPRSTASRSRSTTPRTASTTSSAATSRMASCGWPSRPALRGS